jgi:hypothetical protein
VDRRARWAVEDKDDLDRLDRLAADAWAGRGAVRWDGRRKAEDHDCPWASVRDFLWEVGRDCQWAEDVVAVRRAAQQHRPEDGQPLADPAFAGRGVTDVGSELHLGYFAQRAATAGREERVEQAAGRKELECVARRVQPVLQLREGQEPEWQERTER